MPYVLKTDDGKYLQSRDAWKNVLTEDIYQARVYLRKSDATRSGNNQGRYNRNKINLFPVEVEIKEVS